MTNPFAHIELTTTDLKAAKSFYKKLFDWKLNDMPMGDAPPYSLIDTGSKETGGGMQAQPMPEAPVAWLPYVLVDNLDRTLAKAEKNGAKIVLPKMDIGAQGFIGIFIDPAGAQLGVWQKAKAMKKAKKTAKKAAKKATKKAAKKKR